MLTKEEWAVLVNRITQSLEEAVDASTDGDFDGRLRFLRDAAHRTKELQIMICEDFNSHP